METGINVCVFPTLDPIGKETNSANLDRSTFSQSATLRFTKIPFTTIYGDARLQQERSGQYEEEIAGPNQFMRRTDTSSDVTDIKAGFNTSPWRHVSLSGYYRRSDSETDYGNSLKEVNSNGAS